MRYAIVSDIHANLVAWEAVLADLRESNIDEVVCLGDVVGYGPKPAEVLEAVRAVTSNFVMGNHDAAAVGMMDYSIFNDHAREAIEWTMEELDEGGKEFLSSVPLAIEAEDVLFVHAEIEEPGRFDYIDGVEMAQQNFESGKHFVTFVGHTHLPKVFEMDIFGEVTELTDDDIALDSDSRYIVNVGSVGEPRNPEDLRGRYAIYDTETKELDFRRVEFDILAYRRDLEATSLSLRPFFLRTYEHDVEGREVAVSKGGSLVDMRVVHGSASLIDPRLVSNVGSLSGSQPMLASAAPSKAPKIILALCAVVAIGMVIAIQMVGHDGAPVVKKEKKVEKKDPVKRREERSFADGGASGNDLPSPASPEAEADPIEETPDVPLKAKTPDPEEKKAMAAKSDAEEKPKVKPKPPEPKPKKVVASVWWRMDGKGEKGPLVDGGKNFKLGLIEKGTKISPIAPDPIPLNNDDNKAALKVGIWQEDKPSGEFVLGPKHSFTFEGWLLAGKINRPVFLLGTRTGKGGGRGWHLDIRPPGRGGTQGQMSFFFDSGKEITEALAEEVIVADLKPHHFAAVWDHDKSKDRGEMRLYLDGVHVASNPLSHAGLSIKQANPLRVGRKGNPNRLALDELRFSRDALEPHEFLLRSSVVGVRMIKSDNSRDSWAVPENWEGGEQPKGDDNVIIGNGLTVQLEKKEISKYSGALVLMEKSKMILWGDKSLSALPKGDSKLVLHRDAQLIFRTGNFRFGPVEVLAESVIWGGASTNGHRGTRQFSKKISGQGKLKINGVNKNTFIFEATNDFTGGMEAYSSQKQAFRVMAKGKGNLGRGDVTIGDYCSLVLEKDSGDVIKSDMTLRLEGANGSLPQKLVLNSGESVGAFFINGKDQGVGTFSAKTHKEIGGTGELKVKGLKK